MKYIIIVLVLIFATLMVMYVSVNLPWVYRESISFPVNSHIYDNPDRSIKNIKIAVFYFVPKDRATSQLVDWKEILEDRLKKLVAFHSLEFRNTSLIRYAIYPEPVIGLKEGIMYDTDVTKHGNPQALVHVAEEIDARIFDTAGDLYRKDFSMTRKEEYSVLLILYEGVGASGAIIYDSKSGLASGIPQKFLSSESIIYPVKLEAVDSLLLLNRDYITKTQNSDTGTTVLAHEFYHTLGIPDGYEAGGENDMLANISVSNDIMGIGRTRSIDKAYISNEVLKKMGL